MRPFLATGIVLLLVSELLLASTAPAYGRYALEDFNLDGVTTAEFLAGVCLLLLAVVVGAVVLPALLGWAAYKWLLRRYPGYSARLFPSLALACLASWAGPLLLGSLLGNGYVGSCCALLLPPAGATLGYYATRRMVPAARQAEVLTEAQ